MAHRTAGRQRFERPAHPKRPQGDQSALLVAATRRGPAATCAQHDEEPVTVVIPSSVPHVTYAAPAPPADFVPYPPSRAVASHLTDDRLADREIGFADIPDENPDLLSADPQPAEQPRGIDPAPLRAGHDHADSVLTEMREELNEHTVHHQLPKGWLRSVSPLSALDVDQRIVHMAAAAADFTRDLDGLVDAVRAVALEDGGDHALSMLFAPVADLLTPLTPALELMAMMIVWNLEAEQDAAEQARVGDRDGRPVVARVGFDLETAVAA